MMTEHTDSQNECDGIGEACIISEGKSDAVMKHGGNWNILVCWTFLIEFFMLIFITLLEYFLRWTDVFPLRRQKFDCTDVTLLCSKPDVDLMADFAIKAQVPDEAVFALSLCVPPFVLLIGELGSTVFSSEAKASLRLSNQHCFIPQVVRRLLRFVGLFLFGAISSMIFVDIIKLVIGELSPNFLEQCQVNRTSCSTGARNGDEICLNLDKIAMREARTSFPSLNASITAYSAMFISIYLHGVLRTHTVGILGTFLSLTFIMLSLLCGLSEYIVCRSHCADVASGFAIGLLFALYIVIVVLNQFQEQHSQLNLIHSLHSQIANRDMHVKHYCGISDFPPLHMPRAHMTQKMYDSTNSRIKQRSAHDTFHRDTSHTVENLRRSSYLTGTSSRM